MRPSSSGGARGFLPLVVLAVVALSFSACGGPAGPDKDTAVPYAPVGPASTLPTESGPATEAPTSSIAYPAAEEEESLGDELELLLQTLIDADAAADALEGVPELQ